MSGQTNISIAILSIIILAGCEAKMEWECYGTGASSMQCAISNTGNQAGEVCFDIVAVCPDGEHIANVCSGKVEAGAMRQKVVNDFRPEIGMFTQCQGFEYRNEEVTLR